MKPWSAVAALMLSLGLIGCSHPQPVYYAPPPPPPPSEFRAIAEQGFHDGYEAARDDVEDRRPLVVERHRRFQEPPVPPEGIRDYRRAFARGYGAFVNHLPPPRGY